MVLLFGQLENVVTDSQLIKHLGHFKTHRLIDNDHSFYTHNQGIPSSSIHMSYWATTTFCRLLYSMCRDCVRSLQALVESESKIPTVRISDHPSLLSG